MSAYNENNHLIGQVPKTIASHDSCSVSEVIYRDITYNIQHITCNMCMYVYIYIYIHTYTHVYAYVYVYIYIYIYIYVFARRRPRATAGAGFARLCRRSPVVLMC